MNSFPPTTATEYVVPESAYRDLLYKASDAEYADMRRVNFKRSDEPDCIKVLRAHERMVRNARAVNLHAELALGISGRKVNAVTGEHDGDLFSCFTVRDLSVDFYPIDRRDEIRLPALLDDLAQRCRDEHRNHSHPFCPGCRGDDAELLAEMLANDVPDLEAKQEGARAELSLRRWLALNPGRSLPEVDDTWTQIVEQDDPFAHGAFLDDAALGAMPEPEWLVPGLVPKHSTGILAGRDRSWKSFMALDLALQVVLDGGRVLYCIGEGASGFAARRDSWLAHHGLTIADLGGRMHYVNGVPNLFRRDDVYTRVIEKAEREKFDLVIVDTYARAARGSNLNDGGDQAVVTGHIDAIKRACGGTVLAVAHTQKADGDTTGHSEIEDARDFVLHMKREGDAATLKVTKMKNFDEGQPRRLAPLQVGESIVLVDPVDAPTPLKSSHSVKNRVLVALASQYHLGYVTNTAIREVMGDDRSGIEFHRGSVHKVLDQLVGDGVVEKHQTSKNYRLVAANETAERYLKEITR